MDMPFASAGLIRLGAGRPGPALWHVL